MKKVYDKVIVLVNTCFNSTHKGNLFSQKIYQTEKDTSEFLSLLKQEETKLDEYFFKEGIDN